MSDIFFLEKEKDTYILQKYLAKDDTIIALSHVASYALEKNGLAHESPEASYYSHQEIHKALVEYTPKIREIMKHLDDIVFDMDDRFRKLELGPFYYSLFDTEVPILSIITRIFEIKSIFEKERPIKVKIINQGELISEGVRFTGKGSLINEVIKLLKNHYNYELMIYESKERGPEEDSLISMSKEYKKFQTVKAIFIEKSKMCLVYLQNFRNRTLSHAPYFVSKLFIKKRHNKILNVDSYELRCIMNKLIKDGWVVYNFLSARFNKNKIEREYKFKRRFEEVFEKDNKLKKMLEFSGVCYFEIISKQLIKFCDCFEGMLNDYYWLDNYLKNSRFDIAFFYTHSSWNTQNKLLPIILKKNKIPYVCWMHGGYGANRTVSGGYHSSDYLLGDRYFVYGEAIKCMIDKHYSDYNLKTYTAGSPSLENTYRNYVKPRNNKKIIAYIFPVPAYTLNEVYTQECMRYKRFGYWLPIRSILNVLSKYQDDYHIILRPYNSKIQIQLLLGYLKDIKAANIEISSTKENPLKDILFKSDLLISNSVSTAFFEASMTQADIFLLDDSDLTEEAENIINKRTFRFREIPDFCKNLDKYLEDGKFYQKSDSTFIKEFLDIDNRENRADRISKILDSILDN